MCGHALCFGGGSSNLGVTHRSFDLWPIALYFPGAIHGRSSGSIVSLFHGSLGYPSRNFDSTFNFWHSIPGREATRRL